MFLVVLIQTTLQWHQIRLTSEIWANQNPGSIRAAQLLANQYLKFGDPVTARQILDRTYEYNPNSAMIQIQRTLICTGREEQFEQHMKEVTTNLKSVPLDHAAALNLTDIAQTDFHPYCPQLTHQDIADLVDALLVNPDFQQAALAKSNLLIAKGFSQAQQDHIAPAIDLFVHAFHVFPHLDTAFTGASLMSNTGEYDRAEAFLRDVRQQAPSSAIKKMIWNQRIDTFDYILQQSRLIDESKRKNGTSSSSLE